jgi:hypothetical protein
LDPKPPVANITIISTGLIGFQRVIVSLVQTIFGTTAHTIVSVFGSLISHGISIPFLQRTMIFSITNNASVPSKV